MRYSEINPTYTYAGNCTHQGNAPYLDDMIDAAKQVGYRTLAAAVGRDQLADTFPDFDWSKRPKDLTLSRDPNVSFYQSTFNGMPCFYVRESGVEYIFADQEHEAAVSSAKSTFIDLAGKYSAPADSVFSIDKQGTKAIIGQSTAATPQAARTLLKWLADNEITEVDDCGDDQHIDQYTDWLKGILNENQENREVETLVIDLPLLKAIGLKRLLQRVVDASEGEVAFAEKYTPLHRHYTVRGAPRIISLLRNHLTRVGVLDQFVSEAKMFSSAPYKGHRDETFYENPSVSELNQMLPQRDLRGLSDGKNIFVWDAKNMIHSQAASAIAAASKWKGEFKPPLYDGDRPTPQFDILKTFYLFDPESYRHMDADEWVGDPEHMERWGLEMYQCAPHVVVSFMTQGRALLDTIPAFARLMRRAQPFTIDKSPE